LVYVSPLIAQLITVITTYAIRLSTRAYYSVFTANLVQKDVGFRECLSGKFRLPSRRILGREAFEVRVKKSMLFLINIIIGNPLLE
jgi:hypothetical protein